MSPACRVRLVARPATRSRAGRSCACSPCSTWSRSSLSDAFLEPVYVGNILRQAAPVGIAAIGTTLVMILGCVDLSIGAIISFTAVLCAVLMAGDAGTCRWPWR